MLTVAHVMTTATSPNNGPHCMTCQWPEPVGEDAEDRREDELRGVERGRDQRERECVGDGDGGSPMAWSRTPWCLSSSAR